MGKRGLHEGPDALFEWRTRVGVSRQELAELLGLKHSSSIWLYESGRQPLTFPRLLDLQRITGLSIWVLAWPGQRLLMDEIVRTAPAAQVMA